MVVKGTTHTGMKEIRTKATVITFASFSVGQFSRRIKKISRFHRFLAVGLQIDISYLGEKCLNRVAVCLESASVRKFRRLLFASSC